MPLLSKDALIIGEDIKRVLYGPPDETMRMLLADLICFVESGRYVTFAEEVE